MMKWVAIAAALAGCGGPSPPTSVGGPPPPTSVGGPPPPSSDGGPGTADAPPGIDVVDLGPEARTLLAANVAEDVTATRAYVRVRGALRVVPDGPPASDGLGKVADHYRFDGTPRPIVVVADTPRPRVLVETGGVRLIAFLDRSDLHPVTVVRTELSFDVAAGTAPAPSVSLPAGAILTVDSRRTGGPGAWITHVGEVCPVRVHGWAPASAIGHVFTPEPVGTAAADAPAHAGTIMTETPLLAAPGGPAIGDLRRARHKRAPPIQVETIGAAADGHRLIAYECEGMRVRAYVDARAVDSRARPQGSAGNHGHGGYGMCDGPIPATDAVSLARGTLLYGPEGREPVAAVTKTHWFRRRAGSGVAELCVDTDWGELWLRARP